MDKREALAMFLKVSHECSKHPCSNCPFNETFNGRRTCIWNYVDNTFAETAVEAKLDSMGEKQEVKPSVPPENLKATTTLYVKAPISAEEFEKQLKALLPYKFALEPLPKEDRAIKMPESSKPDNVNHPKHYCKGGLECIQVIKAQLTPEQNIGYLYGNVLKYMWRWPEKNGIEDLRKAKHYLEWLQEEVGKNANKA